MTPLKYCDSSVNRVETVSDEQLLDLQSVTYTHSDKISTFTIFCIMYRMPLKHALTTNSNSDFHLHFFYLYIYIHLHILDMCQIHGTWLNAFDHQCSLFQWDSIFYCSQ